MDLWTLLGTLWLTGQLRERDGWTREQLHSHQARSLPVLRGYAYARSPFYQEFHRGLTDRSLEDLPVLTKALLMEHFDGLVTDRAVRLADVEAHLPTIRGDDRFLGRYWVAATSGSTGRPGLFLFDRSEWMAILASFARGHDWAGSEVGLTHRMRMASIASTTQWHMSARVATTLRSWWMPSLRLDAADPVDTTVRQLNAWQPEMLVAYASMARILADEQLAGSLRISPHLVFTSSEVLTDETRRRVEWAWGKKPFNQYAATECGGLAAECEQHIGLHLFEDLVIAEVVDKDYCAVPPGVYGDKLLITVLSSRTLPLIRYELSDSVRLATMPCPCGRPYILIDDIQGRSEDVLWFAGASGGRVPVQPNVFHRVLDSVPASGWQIAQEPDGLSVLLSGVREGFSDQTLVESLRRELLVQEIVIPTIKVERVAAISRGATGKAALIRAGAPARAMRGP